MGITALVGFAPAANAAVCSGDLVGNTCTLVGTTITYQYDNTQAALDRFGSPTLIGDAVRFLPTGFRADSIDGVGQTTGTNTDSVVANFVFDRVYSNDGVSNVIDLQIVERGDYEITNGNSAPASNVSGDLYVQALNNEPGSIFDFVEAQDSVNFSGDSGGKQLWTMMAGIQPLAGDFWDGPSNDIAVTIQNTLTAFTDESGEQAWIQKKLTFTAGTVMLPPVPVPASVWLFGSALGLLGWMRRRTH